MSNKSPWLEAYYNRIQNDCEISITRRDNVTNWSYTLLGAILVIYFGFFSDKLLIPPFWRYSLVVGLLVILIRFFYQSLIAYGYFLRARYLRTQIERHWINENDISLEKIIVSIKDYDHGKAMPKTDRNRFVGQVRSGFILILAVPIILIINEFYLIGQNVTWQYFLVLGGLVGYVLYEYVNFVTYDQMRPLSKKQS